MYKEDIYYCPVCHGYGAIKAPKKIGAYTDIKAKAAKILQKNGFSVREIMNLMGYKSPLSIQLLLKKNTTKHK